MGKKEGKEISIGRDPYDVPKEKVILLREKLLSFSQKLIDEDKEVVGYSVLFTGEEGHMLDSGYPPAINAVILALHTGLLSDEEYGILTVMEHAINKRIKEGSEDGGDDTRTSSSEGKKE